MADKFLQASAVPPYDKVTFIGMDWSRTKDWSAVMCPRCRTPHRFRTRLPKHCHHCDLKFSYTANTAENS